MCDKKGNSIFCRWCAGATNRENAEYCLPFTLLSSYIFKYCYAIQAQFSWFYVDSCGRSYFRCFFHADFKDLQDVMKQLALSELRRVAERFTGNHERVPWRVWYVAASNGDCIRGEEVITLSVDVPPHCPGAYPSRLVQFIQSGQTRRLRDSCIIRANDYELVV